MLIKFSEQIANTFAKIINGYKGEFKNFVKHLRCSFYRRLLLASEANLKPCQTFKMELLAKKSQKVKAVHYFCKNLHVGCLRRF